MTDIALSTAGEVAVVFPLKAEIISLTAAVALTAGLPVYIDANGKAGIADANGSPPINRFRGIALENVGAGQTVDIIVKGVVAGYAVSGLAYDAPVYLSDSAGLLADSAGTTSLVVGHVLPMNEASGTFSKVLYVTGFAG